MTARQIEDFFRSEGLRLHVIHMEMDASPEYRNRYPHGFGEVILRPLGKEGYKGSVSVTTDGRMLFDGDFRFNWKPLLELFFRLTFPEYYSSEIVRK